jgi:Sortilin, neurotensin receptor 3,
MRFRGVLEAAAGWRSFTIAALLISSTTAEDKAPKIVSQRFDNPPINVQYFEDSDVVLFQDWKENVIWRTENAGLDWKKVSDIPLEKAWTMFMHPFDHQRAYVLTKGVIHYQTRDKGETWQKFQTDVQPSSWRAMPMAFHAGDPDRIIFNGQDCLGIFCEELVCKIWPPFDEQLLNFVGYVHY